MFDSGIGGLTVLHEIAELLPEESVIYIGDEAHFPYGEKTVEQIKQYSIQICEWLENQGIKIIVIACNTITAAAFDDICSYVKVPVIGVVDAGVQAIIDSSKNLKVGILATQATIDQQIYDRKLLQANSNVEVTSVAAPYLVRAVEDDVNMVRNNPSTRLLDEIKNYCEPFKVANCDTIALACTHFPPATSLIEKELGSNVRVVSPSKKTAEEVVKVLQDCDMFSQKKPQYKFYTTGNTTKNIEDFWDSNFTPVNCSVEFLLQSKEL